MLGWLKSKKWLVLNALLVGVLVFSMGIQVIDQSSVIDRSVKIGVGNERVITLGHITYAAGSVDYTYDGTDDNIQFLAALNALPATGGRLVDVSAVQKNFSATVTRAIPNVTITGTGYGSYFTNDGVTDIFTAGGNGWTFENLKTDAGGINMGATTGWAWFRVNDGSGVVYDVRTPAGSMVNGAVVASSIITTDLTVTNAPTAKVGRSSIIVVGADANPFIKLQADYVWDGTGDSNAEVIAPAIAALSAGRTWKEEVTCFGTLSITTEIAVPSYTIFNAPQATITLAGATATHNMINVTDASFSDIILGHIDGVWFDANASVGVLMDGAQKCSLWVYGERLFQVVKMQCTTRAALQNVVHRISTGIVKNCLSLNGTAGRPIEENLFEYVQFNLAIAGAGTGLDFVQYVDRNVFTYVYGYISTAASIGATYNSNTPANDMGVFANNINLFYLDQAGANTVSIDGNRTGTEASYVCLKTTATNPTAPVLQSNSQIIFTPGSKLGSVYYYTNQGYIAQGEARSASGSLTAGNANAFFLAWHNPELQDVYIAKVVIDITTPGGTALSVGQVGIADDATGTNIGTEFFPAAGIDLNAAAVRDSWNATDTGTQTKWVLCQDSASATDGWINGQILTQNATALVGKYYIEYVGR